MLHLRPLIGSVALLALAGVACRQKAAAPPRPEVVLLRQGLASLEHDRSAAPALGSDLESALQGLLPTADEICGGCQWQVSLVAAPAAPYFDLTLRGPSEAESYRVHVFVREELGVAHAGLADSDLAGYPAVLGDRQATAWAGRVEVRLFFESPEVADREGLAALLERMPLAALEQL
jgi:hypothetical protein